MCKQTNMITNLNHLTLAVTNIDQSFAFYRDVLRLKPLVKWGHGTESGGAYFLVGAEPNALWLCLNVDHNRSPSPCYTHYAFSVSTDDFEKMATCIIESGALLFKDNTSPGESLYFEDPDGHKLEIHAGNWQTRIAAKKENLGTWKNVEWFV